MYFGVKYLVLEIFQNPTAAFFKYFLISVLTVVNNCCVLRSYRFYTLQHVEIIKGCFVVHV